MGIISFNLLPAYFLEPELLYIGFLCLATYFIGFKLSDRIVITELNITLNKIILIFSLTFFIGIEAVFKFSDFFSPFMDNVESALQSHKKTEQDLLELARSLGRSIFLISTLLFSRKYKFTGLILLVFYAFMVSGISRSAFIIYLSLGFLNFFELKINLKLAFLLLSLYIVFNFVSKLRKDDENAVLGNPIFTAAAYPIITLKNLNDSEYRGLASNYFLQLLIKPVPGFFFKPFGGKPIFSFNAELTESLNSKLITDGSPISVFTSGAPFVYYRPIYIVFLIHVLMYVLIGFFFNYIRNYRVLNYYCGISVFFLHRSNLLDIISFIIIILFTIIIFKKFN